MNLSDVELEAMIEHLEHRKEPNFEPSEQQRDDGTTLYELAKALLETRQMVRSLLGPVKVKDL